MLLFCQYLKEVLFCFKFELFSALLYWLALYQWKAKGWPVMYLKLILLLHMLALLMTSLIQTIGHKMLVLTFSQLFMCQFLMDKKSTEKLLCIFFIFHSYWCNASWVSFSFNDMSNWILISCQLHKSHFKTSSVIIHSSKLFSHVKPYSNQTQ